ncbi:transposase [Cellulophaga omnivescoria]|uniref:transposase n=1 Tax=Cellulophaga omnivescoria TaxID=1888890 RepID=UPI0009840E4F|nr:transposase [Cellulophaga omnivescoria]
MDKIRRFDNFQHTLSFITPSEGFELFFNRFVESDLCKIYSAIPWGKLVSDFGLKDATKGPICTFSPQGKIALMILKHYTVYPDKRMVEQLNGNIDYHFFCGINLGCNRLTNYKIVSKIRCELGK